MALTDAKSYLEGQGYAVFHLATINPIASGTSTAWVNLGQHGTRGALQVSGFATTTVAPEIHGVACDPGNGAEPTIGVTGLIFGATLTANTSTIMNDLPAFVRVRLPANTTTGLTITIMWTGRHGTSRR